MKTNLLKIVVFSGLAVGLTMGCQSSTEEKAEQVEENLVNAKQDLTIARIDSITEYLKFKEDSESKLQENDNKIADLKEKIKADKASIQTKYEKDVAELDEKNEKWKAKVRDYKEGPKEKWEIFKQDFNREMDDIDKSISAMAHKNTKNK